MMEFIIFGSFFILSLAAFGVNQLAKKTDQQKQSVSNANFLKFQRSFFVVYFLALFGDWLQGPYVYKLYHYYGYKEAEIAVLYVAGFASSVVFGTATGPLADLVGRRRVAQLFCIMYSFCCLTKLSSNFWMLMLGRLFGGISTSMLFSTFESWYVYEHTEHYGFPSEWIGVTFSTTTFWNGMLAIMAGILSNFTAETLGFGPIAPFVVAMMPLVLCGLIITKSWPENYGNRKMQLAASCAEGLRQIVRDKRIFLLGCIQTMVESCMYIFVFLWTPVMLPADPPLGMVFACFMVAIMIGSSVYTLLLAKGYRAEETLRLVMVLLAFTMAICCFTAGPSRSTQHIVLTFGAFLLLEVAIGIYFPAMSYVKSQVIPESHRANVMNWFRVPMNVITCAALLGLNVEWIANDKRVVFAACLGLSVMGILLTSAFIKTVHIVNKNKVEEVELVEEKETLLLEEGK